jgi:hypothetical protein
MTASTQHAPSEPEPSAAASWVVTLLPLALLVVMFFVFLRFLRSANARAEEAIRLARETVAELRGIRAALDPPGMARGPDAKPMERESTLSGQTLSQR